MEITAPNPVDLHLVMQLLLVIETLHCSKQRWQMPVQLSGGLPEGLLDESPHRSGAETGKVLCCFGLTLPS